MDTNGVEEEVVALDLEEIPLFVDLSALDDVDIGIENELEKVWRVQCSSYVEKLS